MLEKQALSPQRNRTWSRSEKQALLEQGAAWKQDNRQSRVGFCCSDLLVLMIFLERRLLACRVCAEMKKVATGLGFLTSIKSWGKTTRAHPVLGSGSK